MLSQYEDQLGALDAAWKARAEQVRKSERDAELEEYAATEVRMQALNNACDEAGEEASVAFQAFLTAWGKIAATREKMIAELLPWHRKSRRHRDYSVMELRKPPTEMSMPLLAAMAGAGLPNVQVTNLDALQRRVREPTAVQIGAGLNHLGTLYSFRAKSGRDEKDA